jgi:hypothetical protein
MEHTGRKYCVGTREGVSPIVKSAVETENIKIHPGLESSIATLEELLSSRLPVGMAREESEEMARKRF